MRKFFLYKRSPKCPKYPNSLKKKLDTWRVGELNIIKKLQPCFGKGLITMKFLRHMTENLFISFTGLAALVHSTWSLGTMFSGVMPESDWWALAWWGVPAFFVAFAMDIGQISTSADIRHKGLTWQRGLTFFVFAIATYYLQFLYIAHHMPALAIADGVSDFHRWTVVTARDAAIWILPLLLPLATMLYTISDGDSQKEEKTKTVESPIEAKENILPANLNEIPEIIQEPVYVAFCEDCQWTKEYETQESMVKGLNTHSSRHCKAKNQSEEILINDKIVLGDS